MRCATGSPRAGKQKICVEDGGNKMIVRKVRGQNKIDKIILSKTEADVVRRRGISLEEYVKVRLVQIAKERRWKWFFNKEETKCLNV